MSAQKKKTGRPPAYDPKYAERAFIFCSEDGFTDKKLALAFGCCEKTLNNWKRDYPEFLQSIIAGKDEWDSNNAEKSLLKRVKGFSYTETTKEPNQSGKLEVTKKVKKHIAPDPTSLIFFLKNRQPSRWRDKQQLELDFTPETLNAVLAGLPTEYAEAVRAELAKAVGKK